MIFRLEKLVPLPMIELSKAESSVWEADSFEFVQGKKYLAEAASGKGKTSLLSIMYGLRKDFNGMFFIDEISALNYNSKKWSHLRKERVSFIFQGLELFDELTAMDNILLKNKITGYKSKQQIMAMAERLDVEIYLKKKCMYLSFGQKQRIAILRSLCQPFNFLFADECFSHIDRLNSSNAMLLIKEQCEQQGAGLIFTSLGNTEYAFDYRLSL